MIKISDIGKPSYHCLCMLSRHFSQYSVYFETVILLKYISLSGNIFYTSRDLIKNYIQ